MIQYKEAINIIRKVSLKISSEKISILKSVNRICDTDVKSPSINPLHNNTAFDGFAVIAQETKRLSAATQKCWHQRPKMAKSRRASTRATYQS